jgi:hypothetical protein
LDDAPPIIGAGVRSRRCTRLRLAPGISAGRPSVLLSRCYVTASALARPLWRHRRYQSSPLLECVKGLAPLSVLRATPSMTLRRSVPASGLAGVRVSGWPRGSAPGVPACCFSAATALRVLSPDRRRGSGDTNALRCLSASSEPGGPASRISAARALPSAARALPSGSNRQRPDAAWPDRFYDLDITGVTDYGVSMDAILAGKETIPLQGARFDLKEAVSKVFIRRAAHRART